MQTLTELATWAAALELSDVPPDVAHRAALLHLSLAAAAPSSDEPAAAAAEAEATSLSDLSATGHALTGAVAATAWAETPWRDALLATVVATEVVERIALFNALTPVPGAARLWPIALGAALATARLRGLDAATTARVAATVLARPRELAADELLHRERHPASAAAAVREGLAAVDDPDDTAPLDLLERPGGLPGTRPFAVLPEALGALGSRWLTRSVTYRLTPVAPWAVTAVEAAHEIVRRHLKAASKPLRVDQIERIEVRLDHLAWARTTGSPDGACLVPDIPEAIAIVLATSPEGMRLPPLQVNGLAERIAPVVERTTVLADPGLTLDWARWNAHTWGPVLAGVGRRTWLRLFHQVGRLALAHDGIAPPDSEGWRHLWQGRKAEMLTLLRTAPGSLSDVDDTAVHVSRPVEIRLETTRGGAWIERRDVADGGPELHLADTTEDVLSKLGDLAQAGREALETGWDRPAGDVAASLRR